MDSNDKVGDRDEVPHGAKSNADKSGSSNADNRPSGSSNTDNKPRGSSNADNKLSVDQSVHKRPSLTLMPRDEASVDRIQNLGTGVGESRESFLQENTFNGLNQHFMQSNRDPHDSKQSSVSPGRVPEHIIQSGQFQSGQHCQDPNLNVFGQNTHFQQGFGNVQNPDQIPENLKETPYVRPSKLKTMSLWILYVVFQGIVLGVTVYFFHEAVVGIHYLWNDNVVLMFDGKEYIRGKYIKEEVKKMNSLLQNPSELVDTQIDTQTQLKHEALLNHGFIGVDKNANPNGVFYESKQETKNEIVMYMLRCLGCLVSALFTGYLTTYVVPECVGGGMVAVQLCLGANVSIPLKVGIARFLITSIYIGFGNTLGMEAPTLHICGSVTCFSYELFSAVFGEVYFPVGHRSTMIMIGSATGIACAFDTPFGGILFVIEEFLKGGSGSKSFNFLLVVSVTCGVVIRRCLSRNESFFDLILDSENEGGKAISSSMWMLYSIPIGVLSALVSVVFVGTCVRVKKFFYFIFNEAIKRDQEIEDSLYEAEVVAAEAAELAGNQDPYLQIEQDVRNSWKEPVETILENPEFDRGDSPHMTPPIPKGDGSVSTPNDIKGARSNDAPTLTSPSTKDHDNSRVGKKNSMKKSASSRSVGKKGSMKKSALDSMRQQIDYASLGKIDYDQVPASTSGTGVDDTSGKRKSKSDSKGVLNKSKKSVKDLKDDLKDGKHNADLKDGKHNAVGQHEEREEFSSDYGICSNPRFALATLYGTRAYHTAAKQDYHRAASQLDYGHATYTTSQLEDGDHHVDPSSVCDTNSSIYDIRHRNKQGFLGFQLTPPKRMVEHNPCEGFHQADNALNLKNTGDALKQNIFRAAGKVLGVVQVNKIPETKVKRLSSNSNNIDSNQGSKDTVNGRQGSNVSGGSDRSGARRELKYVYPLWFLRAFDTEFRPAWAAFVTSILGCIAWNVIGFDWVFFCGKQDVQSMMLLDLSVPKLLVFFVAKFISTAFAAAADSSGGIFYPALVLGSIVGAVMKMFVRWFYLDLLNPDDATTVGYTRGYNYDVGNTLAGTNLDNPHDPVVQALIDSDRYHLLPILGMIGVFSAIIRCPLSSVVIVYEMTSVGKTRADFIFPSLIASMVAFVVSSELQPLDFYETLMRLDIDEEDAIIEDRDRESSQQESTTSPSVIAAVAAVTSKDGALVNTIRAGGLNVGHGIKEPTMDRATAGVSHAHTMPHTMPHATRNGIQEAISQGAFSIFSYHSTDGVKNLTEQCAGRPNTGVTPDNYDGASSSGPGATPLAMEKLGGQPMGKVGGQPTSSGSLMPPRTSPPGRETSRAFGGPAPPGSSSSVAAPGSSPSIRPTRSSSKLHRSQSTRADLGKGGQNAMLKSIMARTMEEGKQPSGNLGIHHMISPQVSSLGMHVASQVSGLGVHHMSSQVSGNGGVGAGGGVHRMSSQASLVSTGGALSMDSTPKSGATFRLKDGGASNLHTTGGQNVPSGHKSISRQASKESHLRLSIFGDSPGKGRMGAPGSASFSHGNQLISPAALQNVLAQARGIQQQQQHNLSSMSNVGTMNGGHVRGLGTMSNVGDYSRPEHPIFHKASDNGLRPSVSKISEDTPPIGVQNRGWGNVITGNMTDMTGNITPPGVINTDRATTDLQNVQGPGGRRPSHGVIPSSRRPSHGALSGISGDVGFPYGRPSFAAGSNKGGISVFTLEQKRTEEALAQAQVQAAVQVQAGLASGLMAVQQLEEELRIKNALMDAALAQAQSSVTPISGATSELPNGGSATVGAISGGSATGVGITTGANAAPSNVCGLAVDIGNIAAPGAGSAINSVGGHNNATSEFPSTLEPKTVPTTPQIIPASSPFVGEATIMTLPQSPPTSQQTASSTESSSRRNAKDVKTQEALKVEEGATTRAKSAPLEIHSPREFPSPCEPQSGFESPGFESPETVTMIPRKSSITSSVFSSGKKGKKRTLSFSADAYNESQKQLKKRHSLPGANYQIAGEKQNHEEGLLEAGGCTPVSSGVGGSPKIGRRDSTSHLNDATSNISSNYGGRKPDSKSERRLSQDGSAIQSLGNNSQGGSGGNLLGGGNLSVAGNLSGANSLERRFSQKSDGSQKSGGFHGYRRLSQKSDASTLIDAAGFAENAAKIKTGNIGYSSGGLNSSIQVSRSAQNMSQNQKTLGNSSSRNPDRVVSMEELTPWKEAPGNPEYNPKNEKCADPPMKASSSSFAALKRNSSIGLKKTSSIASSISNVLKKNLLPENMNEQE